MVAKPWCSVSGCRERARYLIHTRSGKHRPFEPDSPATDVPVCAYHLALFVRWESQGPIDLRDAEEESALDLGAVEAEDSSLGGGKA